MKPSLLVIAAAFACSVARAEDVAPAPENSLRFHVQNADIRKFFFAVEAQLDVKILVADDVQG